MTKKLKIIISIIYAITLCSFIWCLIISIINRNILGIGGYICAIMWEICSYILLMSRSRRAELYELLYNIKKTDDLDKVIDSSDY